MKIFVTAKPNAREQSIEKNNETSYTVSVKEAPVQGRANIAIIKAIAEYFDVAPSRVRIISGWTSRQKTLEIS